MIRDMTVKEEIIALDIDEQIKDRILNKLRRMDEEMNKTNDYLVHCHSEIDILGKAIVSQAKIIGRLEDEIRNKDIHCDD